MAVGEIYQELNLPNYYNIQERDLRRKFLTNKKDKIIKNKRTELLDKYLFNNTEYLDGIVHYEINENNTKINKINKIEDEFKTILAMKGVKYIYKRGFKWRTWRQVSQNGGKKIICYVCESIVKNNCTGCQIGGHWIIEEKPPCPYELFSIKDKTRICAINYTEYFKFNDDCPSLIKFEDLGVNCVNPMETVFRITRDYKAGDIYPSLLCNGKEYCDITTIYTIDAQGISFRIINASNIIFYSRVMKNDGRNYACVHDCGVWDPNARKLIAQPNPLSFNLLANKKKKREDSIATTKSTKKFQKSTKRLKFLSVVDESAGIPMKSTTMSHCKKLEQKDNDYLYDSKDSDYEA